MAAEPCVQPYAQSYWSSLARSYAAVGPPLQPSKDDIGFVEQAVGAWSMQHPNAALHALLLGVTPGVADMAWPVAAMLLAIDSSLAMTQEVWPGNIPRRRQALCGDWLALPLRESSCDMVIGDGAMNCLRYPDGFLALAASVHGALRPDGLFILRCYTQPATQETPEEVLADMRRDAIPTFHEFKFRLLMAMQANAGQGIPVGDVYRICADQKIDDRRLPGRPGWAQADLETIEMYRDSDTVHTFPTITEFRAVLREYFDETGVRVPSYNLGKRCPTLILRPRRDLSNC